MAQSDRNIDRDLRAMRRDQLREGEDRATAERRFREMEDARRRDEEYRRQMEAEEQRKILEEEDRRLAEEERQMRYFEEQRRKDTENQLLALQRQRQQIMEQRRGTQSREFGDGITNTGLLVQGSSGSEQNRRDSRTSDRTSYSDTQYESFGLERTQTIDEQHDSNTEKKEILGTRNTTEKKRVTHLETPERIDTEGVDFIQVLSTEIKDLDKRLASYGRGLLKSAKDTRTTDEKYVAPRELFRERPSQERIMVQIGEEREPLKKRVTITQDTIKETEKEKKFHLAYEPYRMTERDLVSQQEKMMLLKRREEELLQKEEQLMKLEREQASQREMSMMFQRREDEIKEKEEKLRKLERDLSEIERLLESQETLKNSYDEELQERDRQVELRLADMNRRQKLIEEREAALYRARTTRTVLTETKDEKLEEIPQQVLEDDRHYIQKLTANKSIKEEEEYRKDIATNTEKPPEPQNLDRSLQFPKFSPFSGEDPKPKSEASYDEWKYEVSCTRRDGIYSDEIVAQAIRRSVRGQAKRVLLTMGITASVESILKRLEGVFGNVATGESILQEFYTAFQKQEESVNGWGLRLEEILQKAIDKGHVKDEEKDDRLRQKFWRGLRSEKLRNATRLQFESIKNFEMLRSAVRAEESEMKRAAATQYQPMRAQYKGDKIEDEEEDSKLDRIMKKLAEMDSEIKDLKQQKPKKPFYDRRRPYYPNQNQQKPTPEDPKTEQAKTEEKKSGN